MREARFQVGPIAVLLTAAVACGSGDRDHGAATASAPAVSSAPPAPSAATPPAAFELVRSFPAKTRLYGVETAVLACEAECRVPKKDGEPAPKISVVTRDRIEDDPKLWLEGFGDARSRAYLAGKGEPVVALYWGRYPDRLRGVIEHPTDNTTSEARSLQRSGERWVYLGPQEAYDRPVEHRWLPPDSDDAIAHAPFEPGKWSAWGSGGPLLITAGPRVAVWNGAVWSELRSSFGDTFSAHRLRNGATVLVTDKGAFLVSKTAEIARIELPGVAALDTFDREHLGGWPVQGALWFGVVGSSRTDLFAPTSSTAFALDEQPAGDRYAKSTNVRHGDHELDEMPAPTGPSSACATPFVNIATPSNLSFWPVATIEALKGHGELQDEILRFVVYARGSSFYFGAQAKTQDGAKRLIDVLVAKNKLMKPQLGCLDALAHAANGPAPARYVRAMHINLQAGFIVRTVE